MSDPRMRDVAPRLWAALEAERDYQQRWADARRTGIVPAALAFEEMSRSIHRMAKAYLRTLERMREQSRCGSRAGAR